MWLGTRKYNLVFEGRLGRGSSMARPRHCIYPRLQRILPFSQQAPCPLVHSPFLITIVKSVSFDAPSCTQFDVLGPAWLILVQFGSECSTSYPRLVVKWVEIIILMNVLDFTLLSRIFLFCIIFCFAFPSGIFSSREEVRCFVWYHRGL